MNIDALKTFLLVAEQSSFSGAAARLQITQPAVSRRIATLEEELAVQLLDRADKTVSLTEAGRTLVARARLILEEIERTRELLQQETSEISGKLLLVTNHHIGVWRLPALLKTFSQRFPEVSLELQFLDSEAAARSVADGEAELALVTLPPARLAKCEYLKVWDETLSFVTAREDTLLRETSLNMETLARYPAVLPDMTTLTGRIIRQAFSRRGLTPKVSSSTNYLETLKMLSSIGMGWTLIPDSMVDSSLTVIDVNEPSPTRALGFMYLKHRTLSSGSRAFIQMVMDGRHQADDQPVPSA